MIRGRLLLLGGQALALGLTMAFLVVPASALFLHTYGATDLPYVYLLVAVAGVAVSWSMRRAQARLSLAGLAATTLGGYVLVVAAAWAVLTTSGGSWVTWALVVLFPLAIPVGFVLVGAQAGRLLDVRQMKEHFPRIVGGFSVGFAVGGLVAAWLVRVLDGPDGLLLVDVATAAAMLALAAETARRHPGQLRARPDPAPPRPEATGPRRRLRLGPLVLAVLGYQVLSAAVTQLLDYVVWERAAHRYPDASDLAHFQGLYGAAINVVAIAFVVLLAGRLLGRHGLSLGLAANPAGVVVLLVVGNLVGVSAGVGGLLFLLVACAQQIGDISLTDGMTRASINTTYQALPESERLRTQTVVEAAGVPLALGLVGAVLLLLRPLGLGVAAVELLSLVVSVAWLVLALVAYREYGAGLRRLVSRRAWEPLDRPDQVLDEATRVELARLLADPDPTVATAALRAVADTPDPGFVPHLVDAAGRRCDQTALANALAAHVDWLGPELVERLVGREGSRVVRDRLAAALTATAGRAEPVRFDLVGALHLQQERTDRARSLLSRLDGSPSSAPLRRALLDELAGVAAETTTLLELSSGQRGLSRAVRALGSDVPGQRALALETVEVTAGRSQAERVLALLQPPDGSAAVGPTPGYPVVDLATAVTDLVDDMDRLWQEPWLRVCALYAATGLLGEGAVVLARPWVDDPDPAVAETARHVVGSTGDYRGRP